METLWKKYSYAIILVVLSFLIGLYLLLNLEEDSGSYQEITVSEGQSLWEIANLYANEHAMSPSDFINWVQDKNNLTTTMIKTGDKIVIPVNVKHQIENNNQIAYDLE